MFFDGQSKGLTDYVWKLAPDMVITSGGMKVTEQHIAALLHPTRSKPVSLMGQEWTDRPTNEHYKDGHSDDRHVD